MILITGATGNLGLAVVDQLLKITSTDQFSVLARNETKAEFLKEKGIEVRIGDFDDSSSLENAFTNIDKLLLISTMEQNRFEQHKNVVDAAVKAGVKHIIYTGLAIKDIETSGVKDLMISHFQTENYIKGKGLLYTFLRNTMYADAIPLIAGEEIFERGISLPGGNGKVPYALRREMGEATANLLLQEGHENKTYDITGSKAYSYQDIVIGLNAITGKEVHYTDVDANTFLSILKDAGVPDFPIYLLSGTVADIRNHQYEIEDNTLELLLGRPTTTLIEFLKEIYHLD
ncbi:MULTISPECIES: SDR family oxidoreductase [unclassified Chryseobacterium]|uniref:SDR family oxidoreductase n=1 Tax=unclassified Chryseobacterium TaxID=2593645 RepID=UPI0009149164|nr:MULTISPECIES: SDR family oxidoreductase [unclassified Chryseobacterium]SHF79762.1 NAD(P)H dehydrogenase (quinone) [Chryseobacterium sp. OV279]HCA09426.1 SDR family NAD(P)-dependent oxidoreductase [Chryseobacterium sp.]